MPGIKNERRRERRLEDFNEITLSVISEEKYLPEDKIFYNYSRDISESGVRIYTDSFLPVDTLLRIEMKLKNFRHMITTPGKVKWVKIISSGGYCEAGVEFLNTPARAMNTLDIYNSWMSMLYPA
ncbi:MAG: PilZ domain-containing protein [Smithella sp.]|nr:PilZ domain-containing protein [Smithella sp.]MDM7988143.1 PilZ domain-containing protein [Smithella sp.]HOU51591.1 PilZ domain-containing protein [Smithella sp.]HQH17256.1 PilZ domain-containing protein [Smithella sp.]HQI73444.1 PilZ domain-containing protein [Smithella sp.]